MKKKIHCAGVVVLSLCLSGIGIAQTGQQGHSAPLVVKAAQTPKEEKVKDPVCGMEISVEKAKGKSQYKKKTYYFCSNSCKEKFDKEPEKYVKK
jgi:YHS domain-containing protein